jgi:hypothetical protein
MYIQPAAVATLLQRQQARAQPAAAAWLRRALGGGSSGCRPLLLPMVSIRRRCAPSCDCPPTGTGMATETCVDNDHLGPRCGGSKHRSILPSGSTACCTVRRRLTKMPEADAAAVRSRIGISLLGSFVWFSDADPAPARRELMHMAPVHLSHATSVSKQGPHPAQSGMEGSSVPLCLIVVPVMSLCARSSTCASQCDCCRHACRGLPPRGPDSARADDTYTGCSEARRARQL